MSRLAAIGLRLQAPRARSVGTPDASDDDSLQNIDTSILPDGALCWVVSNATLYALVKTAGIAPGNIIPISGTGAWVPLLPSVTPSDAGVVVVAITTTNAVPQLLYQQTLAPDSSMLFSASVVAIRGPDAGVIGSFTRQFTAKRQGSNPAVLLQDLVTTPDFQENPGLAVQAGVDANNAILTVTGLSGTVDWHGRIESI